MLPKYASATKTHNYIVVHVVFSFIHSNIYVVPLHLLRGAPKYSPDKEESVQMAIKQISIML